MIREGVKLPIGVQYGISDLVQTVAGDKDVVALYAFGSLARNALKPLSDLDFGTLLSSRLDKNQRFEKHIELIGLFTEFLKTNEVDLINMNDVPPRIAYNILKTGKLLFCSDRPALIDFREHVVKHYLDFKHVRDTFDQIFLKGIRYNG
jgi:predicted nucleotidyltransferase